MNNVSIAVKIVRLGYKFSIRCQSSKPNLSTFYDILNLKPGCTKKEIRNAFITLSKLHHPDISGSSSSDRYVRINEAYSVLIDENKKKLYDETLMHTVNVNYRNPIYYHSSNQQQHQNSEKWKAIYNDSSNHWLSSNIVIAGICLSLLFIGSIAQYYGAKRSTYVRNLLMNESDERLLFLEEQELMKRKKTNEELVKIFEQNIAKK